MKGIFYFQHDFNARNDPKMQNLMMEAGVAGIGAYWCIVEQLYEQGGILPMNQCKSIAFALHLDCKLVESIIKDFDLFQNDGEKFWSLSVNTRIKRQKEISNARKIAAVKSWQSRGKEQEQSNCIDLESNCNAIKNKKENKDIYISSNEDKAKEPENSIKVEDVVSLFHAICKSFPRVMKLNDDRRKKVRMRLSEMKNDTAILETVFRKMEESDFMRGGSWASFDWVFKNATNWVKVYEGNYDNKPSQGKKQTKVNDIWPTQ